MLRKCSTLAAILSAVLAVALIALWIRGFFRRDQICFPIGSHYYRLSTFPHHFYLDRDPGWQGMRGSAYFSLAQYPSFPKYLEIRFIPCYAGAWSLAIPFWLPLMFSLAMPIWWGTKFIKQCRRMATGLCPTCGYDLRATVDRCPECGTPIGEK